MKTKNYLFKSGLISIIIYFSSFSYVHAQDIIYTKDGRELEVTIVNSDGATVQFKKFGDVESPLRTMDVIYIDFVKYEDGTIEQMIKTVSSRVMDNDNASKNYLETEYEKHLARFTIHNKLRKGASRSFYFWTAGFGILSVTGDYNSDFYTFWIVGSAAFLTSWIVEIIIVNSSERKVEYLKSRLENVSFIVEPLNIDYALTGNSNINSYSIGIRYNF